MEKELNIIKMETSNMKVIFINGKREGNGKYIFEDGEYYIGEFKNNKRNGKGIEYYKNGNIKYEGEFINGEFVNKIWCIIY